MSSRIKNVSPKVYNGITYRSTLEAETAERLDAMGIPFKYESRKITLLEGFYSRHQKRKVEHVTYTPDFEIGSNIIVECKGFETPEWKLKKKFVFKYLEDNEKDKVFYQIHDSKGSLLEVLDNHWSELGYAIEVTSRKRHKKTQEPVFRGTFDSIDSAVDLLNLKGVSKALIVNSLTGKKEFAYNYNWKPVKIFL